MTEELGREMTAVPPIRPRGGAQDDRLERDDVLYFSIQTYFKSRKYT